KNDPVEKHEATRVDPEPIEDRTEQYGEKESAETAGETDDTGNNAHIVRKIVANVLEGRCHSERKCDAKCKQQHRDNGRGQSDMEVGGAENRMDDEAGLRKGQEKQADPAPPKSPPRHVVAAETIRKPTAGGAQYPRRKGKARGQQRSLCNAQPVLTHEVL